MVEEITAPIQIPRIGGSTHARPKSVIALRAALSLAEAAEATTELVDPHLLELPRYNSDIAWEALHHSVHWLIAAARRADSLIICSPTYHGTLSGAEVNALDPLDLMAVGSDDMPAESLTNMVVGLIAAGARGAMC